MAALSSKQFSGVGFDGDTGKAQMDHPQAQRMAAGNIAHMYDTAPDHVKESGRLWYPKVHEATAKGAKQTGMSIDHAAGIVAAVSPNMDWEKNNIGAFHELHGLKQEHWDAIHRSAASGKRTPEADSVLKGLSISTAPDSNLLKAHRIMQGEHPDTVLNPRTAPKTNSFFHNIADPSDMSHATVDGRHHDISTNTMRGWTKDRGISSAALPTGKTTRYEHFANATRNAAEAIGEHTSAVQAVAWEHGKVKEMQGLTKAGQPRKVGVRRVGQGYR